MEQTLFLQSPVGKLGISASDDAITRIFFAGKARRQGATPASCTVETAPEPLRHAVTELAEYFAGTRRTFTVTLAPSGTPFQEAVWAALRTIPYGETRSYKQIAEQIGRPAACRAVGMANNRNPIAILIPCHRVVGHNGALVGYAAGLEVKTRLLRIEQQ